MITVAQDWKGCGERAKGFVCPSLPEEGYVLRVADI